MIFVLPSKLKSLSACIDFNTVKKSISKSMIQSEPPTPPPSPTPISPESGRKRLNPSYFSYFSFF